LLNENRRCELFRFNIQQSKFNNALAEG